MDGMSEWDESGLKAAASWKAFKEGRSLYEAGKVVQTKSTPEGWTGSVRSGTKVIRLGVKIPRPKIFDVKCSCAENQATGAVCAHAVATGLALLAGAAQPSTPKADAPNSQVTDSAPGVPLVIRFAPNALESIQRGRLTVTLAPEGGAEADPADVLLAAWMRSEGIKQIKSPLPLSLDENRLSAFLRATIGHPRIWMGNVLFSVDGDGTLPMKAPVREGEFAVLEAFERPILIGGQPWLVRSESLVAVGEGDLDAELLPAFRAWSNGEKAKVGLKILLGHSARWESRISIPEDSWLGDLRLIPATPTFRLELEGSLVSLQGRLTVRYGDSRELSPGDASENDGFPRATSDGRLEIRHFQEEQVAMQTLGRLGFTDKGRGNWALTEESAILAFFARGLPSLSEWEVIQTPRLQDTSKNIELVRPRFEVMGSGEDWLAFDYSFETAGGSIVSRAEVLQWLRSGRSTRQTGQKKQVLDSEAVVLLEPLLGELNVTQENGHFIGSPAIEEVIREFGKNSRNVLNSINELPHSLEASVAHLLRPYQREGVSWLVDRLSRFGGALLADDMGLGKTLQTIVTMEHLFQTHPEKKGVALIVAPTSLLGNWQAEFERFAPTRQVRVLHGSNRDAEREKVVEGSVVITSYGTLARDLAWHLRQHYLAIAIDEASLMRNPDTDHAKAVAKLKGSHRIALSGTPVENGVRDLWSIFRFVQPGWLGSREQFKETYELPLQAKPFPTAQLERLRFKTAPFILRRTKEEVATELPSKIIIDDYCELSSDQRQIYRDILGEGGKRVDETRRSAGSGPARMQLLTTLLRLRQTCCDLSLLKNERLDALPLERRSAKLERLMGRIHEATSNGHKMLIFSQFQTQLRKIEELLKLTGIESFLLDGQTRNRQHLVDRFQKADGPPIFLISLKAGGYGLNLTAADVVVHFDPWWNPAAEMQATDRAHRIGQTRPVTVYRLLTRNTVEEKVVRLQMAKRELAQAAFDENGLGDAAGWSDADLRELLRN